MPYYTFDSYELKKLLMEQAALGVAMMVREQAPVEDELSQGEAFRQFGESTVRRWVRENKIFPVRRGTTSNSRRTYSRAELMALCQAERLQFNIRENDVMKNLRAGR